MNILSIDNTLFLGLPYEQSPSNDFLVGLAAQYVDDVYKANLELLTVNDIQTEDDFEHFFSMNEEFSVGLIIK